MIRRLAAVAGAVAASLAFAASAQAAPSTPFMFPIPTTVCNPVASWTPSTPDPGGQIIGYRLDIGDLTNGTSSAKFTAALSMPLTGLVNGHKYVVRVRALQFRNGALLYSAPSGRVFKKLCFILAPYEIVREYVEYNPWPECPMCGILEDIKIQDPVIYRAIVKASVPDAPERFRGMTLEADGAITF